MLSTYLFFNGNAQEALEFYKVALGGDLEIMRFEGSPGAQNMPQDWGNKVMHGALKSPLGMLMASDATKEHVKNPGDNFAVSFSTENESEADAVFTKLSTGGKITMPFEKTFWNAKFGMLTDKFGVDWMVNCQLPEPAK